MEPYSFHSMFCTATTNVGDNFTVGIAVDNFTEPGLRCYGTSNQSIKLCYDNSLLECVKAWIPEDHFLSPENSSNLFVYDPGTIHQEEDFISFAATLLGSEPGKTGCAILAMVIFKIIKSPPFAGSLSCDLVLRDVLLFGPSGIEISFTQYNVENGYYEYTYSWATPPPAGIGGGRIPAKLPPSRHCSIYSRLENEL